MKPIRLRIQEAAKRLGIPQQVIEKDYALSYILTGISYHPEIKDTLVFKGGTALKKIFFGDYRFSEDLDFSTVNSPKGNDLERFLNEAVEESKRLFLLQGPFEIQLERYLEREPHPHGQEAFIIRVKFPWHPSPLSRIKIEITHDEPVLMTPLKQRIIHGYDEELVCEITSYCLEEIVAEKLRTLLQTHQKLINRGWNRPRARDYYDLWMIYDRFRNKLNNPSIMPLLRQKCDYKSISFKGLDDFFSDELVAEAHHHWNSNLASFVNELPDCSKVLTELKTILSATLFNQYQN